MENNHNDGESRSKLSSMPQQWRIQDFPDGGKPYYLARFLPYHFFYKVHKYGASAGIFLTSLLEISGLAQYDVIR